MFSNNDDQFRRVFLTQDRHWVEAGVTRPPIADSNNRILLCDPLTGLLAYGSFEQRAKLQLASQPHGTLFLAIGDVDDLRGYVTNSNAIDEDHFGHLAGNRCMAQIGRAVLTWEQEETIRYSDLFTGTFGGDEVVICAFGMDRRAFPESLSRLSKMICEAAPRPCSFAWGEFALDAPSENNCDGRYKKMIAAIDRTLFQFKADARLAGHLLNAAIVKLNPIYSDHLQ